MASVPSILTPGTSPRSEKNKKKRRKTAHIAIISHLVFSTKQIKAEWAGGLGEGCDKANASNRTAVCTASVHSTTDTFWGK